MTKKLVINSPHVRVKSSKGILHRIDDRLSKEQVDKRIGGPYHIVKQIPERHLIIIREGERP